MGFSRHMVRIELSRFMASLCYLVYHFLNERHGLRVAWADGLWHLGDVAQVSILRKLQCEFQMPCVR